MTSHSDRQGLFLQRVVLLALAGTSLAFAVNVNDSTVLKRPIFYLCAGLLAAGWISRSLDRRKLGWPESRAGVALLAYIALSAISLLIAPNLHLGGIGIADLLCSSILFFACADASEDPGFASRIAKCFLAVTLLAGLMAIFQSVSGTMSPFTSFPGPRDTISTFGNVTYFAGFLAPALAIIAGQMLISRSSLRRILLALLFAASAYLLITTESRSGWAGAGSGLFLLVLLNAPSGRRRWMMAGALLAAGIAAWFLFPEMVQQRMLGILHVSPTSSIARRLFFYKGAWNAFLASPLIGQGLGNFTLFLPKFRPPDYWMAHSEDIVPHAHNEFLEILSETGLAGFLGFAVVVCLCVYGARKKMKSSPPSERIVTGSYVAALAAILVDNLASMNLRTAPVAAGFWILLALAGGPAAPSKKESGLSLPPWVKSLRLLPYAALGALLVWYIPRVAGRYRAQQSYLAGNLLRYQNRSAESSIRFAEALSDDNELAEARLYLAANLAAESRFEEARNNIDTLLSQNPYYPKARFILAVSRAGLHDTAGAVLALNEEIQIENSPQTVYFASYYQRRMGHTEEEFALVKLLLRNAVRSGSPEFVKEGVGRMTELCGEQAKREECAGIVAETRLSFPQDVPILFAAEDYYERMGLLRDAEETLSQVRALSPDDPGVKERAARLDDLRRPGN